MVRLHHANNNVSYSDQTLKVSFTQEKYSVREDEPALTVHVSVEGSVESDSHVVVLIATHPSEGTATGEGILHVTMHIYT